jgi:hypothetical protein
MKSFESLTYMEEYRRYWAKREDEDGGEDAGADPGERTGTAAGKGRA